MDTSHQLVTTLEKTTSPKATVTELVGIIRHQWTQNKNNPSGYQSFLDDLTRNADQIANVIVSKGQMEKAA